MKRIAIIGGGIAGLAAAYELELARKRGAAIDWQLYEASDRLGGIVETTRLATPEGEYILEGGPDGWVSEKPWARELAVELGLEAELIYSNDATRKTYILIDGKLQAMPDKMRMMVPEDLATLDSSPLFTADARQAYADELASAESLRASAPDHDESVSSFVRRHFGEEVLTKIGAPLLSGVFGGDVERLSVRAVMPAFVRMEREDGSLIAAVQRHARERGDRQRPATFTTLLRGMGSLAEAILAKLPEERIYRSQTASSLKREGKLWCLKTVKGHGKSKRHFQHVLLAAPVDEARRLVGALDAEAAELIPAEASSATLATFCWPAKIDSGRILQQITVPPGFGFLNPQASVGQAEVTRPQLLAATFVNQKFPHRAPEGAYVIRVFFGSGSAEFFREMPDTEVAQVALEELRGIMGPLPTPDVALTKVRRWPRSLPQYEVGHLERMAQLDGLVARIGNLTLLGNGYRGVGVPDLIHHARTAVRSLGLA
jgi:oxygen-dependent protoporphyrinogen oxidase